MVLAQLVEVICDTSFIIHLATTRIKNISSLDVEIGRIDFVVPNVVIRELERLAADPAKNPRILATLSYVKRLRTVDVPGTFADKSIRDHVAVHGGIVATLDRDLKSEIKKSGGSVISLSNDSIVLEP